MIGLKKISRKTFLGILGTVIFLYLLSAALVDAFMNRIPYGIISGIALDVCVDKQEDMDTAGEMVDKSVLQQSFILDTDKPVSCIKISSATYMRTNQGSLQVRLLDAEKQNQVKMWVIDVSKMADNDYLILSMGEQGYYLPGKEYIIEITAQEGRPGNAVTFYTSRKDIYLDGDMQINGRRQTGDLCFQVLEIRDKRSFWHVKIWIRIYMLAALAVLLYVLYEKYGYGERNNWNGENTEEFKVS